MQPNARVSLPLTIGLAIAIALDTVVQLSWKSAVSEIPDVATPWATIEATLTQPMFLVVVGLLLCQLANWLHVLGRADLSFAQPVTSLSRVTVCLASVIFLHEKVSIVQFGGIVLVCLGVWFINRSARAPQLPEAVAP
jgi:drug/metabolite transporter (DMT)-like permease